MFHLLGGCAICAASGCWLDHFWSWLWTEELSVCGTIYVILICKLSSLSSTITTLFFTRYRERAAQVPDLNRAGFVNAAHVDFIFQWLFGVSAPILMVITLVDLFWGIKPTHLTVCTLI